MKYRGVIHLHSNYSYDSMTSIKAIVRHALKNDFNFIALTDHESLEGAKALERYIKQKKHSIEVVVSAEYHTEYGDIIALGVDNEIASMKFDKFVKEVKGQGGLLLFPHPYIGHKEIEKIAEAVDMIEVFNSRAEDKVNEKAILLANKFKKPVYYASDAHTKFSLSNAIIEFEKKGGIKESLLKSEIMLVRRRKSYFFEILYSQFVKSFRNRDFNLLYELFKSTVKSLLRMSLFERV